MQENPNVIEAINRISKLSKDIGEKIWKVPGEAINREILKHPLSSTGELTAKACISLWNGSESINLSELHRYDDKKLIEFTDALRSIIGDFE